MSEPTAPHRDVELLRPHPVLSVRDLVIDALAPDGPERIVDHVSFDVNPGSVFSIVGESGSGKTLTMLAVIGLLPGNIKVTGGEIWLEDQNLLTLSARELRELRGTRLAMIFQDPMTSLNPVIRVGKQVGEIIQIHEPGVSKTDLRDRVIDLLSLVEIPDPGRRYRLRLFASRAWADHTRVTRYVAYGGGAPATRSLTTSGKDIGSDGQYDGNDATIVTMDNLQPDKQGKLHLTLEPTTGKYGYISLMELTVQ